METTLSPFNEMPVILTNQESAVLAEAAMQREVAEVQAAMLIAKRFPRNQAQAMDRVLIACQRPSLAEGALYSYSRGGTDITGPSIRLAEAIAQQWGNLQFGIRELEQRFGESTVEAYAWDLETNTREVKVFQIKHIRHTKKGAYALQDPRDIYEMVANQGARRLRACILGVIPGDVVEAAVTQCETTLKAKADISPEAIQRMVSVFAETGVTKEMIEKRIQRKLESITPAQIIGLRKIFNSLKDGMSNPGDWFEVAPAEIPTVESQASRIKDELTKRRGRPKTAEKPQGKSTGESPTQGQEQSETSTNATTLSQTPVGITPKQLTELDKCPAGLRMEAYEATGIDGTIPLSELTQAYAERLLEYVRKL